LSSTHPAPAVDTFTTLAVGGGSDSGNQQWFVAQINPSLVVLIVRVIQSLHFRCLDFTYLQPRPRKKPVERRWLPGYLFIKFDPDFDPWEPLLDVPGLTRLLGDTPSRPVSVAPGELDRLAGILGAQKGVLDAARRPSIATGDAVKICLGPYASFQAICLRCVKGKITVEGTIFGRRFTTTLALGAVEPA
jgi:transcription antitermination factor NusG